MAYIYLIPILILYVLFDVHYFIRTVFIMYVLRLFRKRLKVLDESIFYGMCTTQDIARNIGSMNNARYQRELDFARYFYSERTGLYSAITKRGITVVGASVIHYYRDIPIFTPYKIVSKMLYWEERSIYLQQKCITLHDNSVRNVSIVKHVLIGPDMNAHQIIAEIEPNTRLPDLPEDLRLWSESLGETSKKFRKRD